MVKIVKIYEDNLQIENALKSKTLRTPFSKIVSIAKSPEVKDALEIRMNDGKYVAFSIYNSYKIQQITQFIADYIANHKN